MRCKSYVSPRLRARRTLELLAIGCKEKLPWQQRRKPEDDEPIRTGAEVEVTEAIREWDYGEYEGLKSSEIRERRKQRGEAPWDIWRDGCPGGESPDDVTRRLDALIAEIRGNHHSKCLDVASSEYRDVLVVAHGHILRAFAMRWIGKPLTETALILEAGGVGTLSYEHHSIDEPAIILGSGFVVEN